jgi:hypothetical protein
MDMRWTSIVRMSTRIAQTVAVIALTVAVAPETEIILAGIKWT